jgi:CDP-diacylglycerol--glycerol-3-phosphate 3-phosphatidyltransferase
VISSKIGHRLDRQILVIYRFIFRQKIISPDIISSAGTFFGFLAAFLVFMEFPRAGAASLAIAGLLDVLDGAVARGTDRVTRFGGFFDSVLDRYTDLSIMGAILFVYVRHGNTDYAITTFIAVIGTALIPYARARAEAASLSCKTGLLERPERLVLLIIGLVFPVLLGYIIIVLAVLTHVTVIQRILHVRKQTR